MTNEELLFICDAVKQVAQNYQEWQKDYKYNSSSNEFENVIIGEDIEKEVQKWFELG